MLGDEKALKAKKNLEVTFRTLLDVNDEEQPLTNEMVEKAVSTVESRTKKRGSGKVISFHDVSTLSSEYYGIGLFFFISLYYFQFENVAIVRTP